MSVLDLKSFSRGNGNDVIRSKRILSHERVSTQKARRPDMAIFPAEIFENVVTVTEPCNFTDNPYAQLEAKSSEFLLRVLLSSRLPPKSAAFASIIGLLGRICNINNEFGSLLSTVEIIVDDKDELIYNDLTSILNIYKLELQCTKLTDEFAEFSGEKVRR